MAVWCMSSRKLFEAGIEPDEAALKIDLANTRGRFATNELGDSYLVKFPPNPDSQATLHT